MDAPVWLLDVDGVINAQRPGWGAAPFTGNGYAREWTSDEAAVAMLMGRLVTAGIAPKIAHDVARAGGKLEIGPGVVVLVEADPTA